MRRRNSAVVHPRSNEAAPNTGAFYTPPVTPPSVYPGIGPEQQEQRQRQQHEAEDHTQGQEGEREAPQAEVQQLPLR